MLHLDDALLRRALEVGRTLDLRDCFYDPTRPTGGGTSRETPLYYALLAGLVRETGARTVLELGTHFGGATLAMARGSPTRRPGASSRSTSRPCRTRSSRAPRRCDASRATSSPRTP